MTALGTEIWSVLSSPEATAAAGTVAKAAASTVAGAATKKLWQKASGSPEAKALVEPIALAFVRSIEASRLALRDGQAPESVDWWSRSGRRLLAPFTDPAIAGWVVTASLRSPNDGADAQGALLAALEDAGYSFSELAAEFRIDDEQFLHVLPGTIADEIIGAAHHVNSPLRGLAELATLRRVADGLQAHHVAALSPWELVDQLARLLDNERRWHESVLRELPYLAGHRDPLALDTAITVKVGLRRRIIDETAIYQPASGRADAELDPPLSLDEAVERHPRLVVLADPGMGKTWLLHTHAARLAESSRQELVAENVKPAELLVPIAVRCDTLAARAPQSLVQAACQLMSERHEISPALRLWLEEHLRGGAAIFLLDALDEVPRAQRGPLIEMVRSWELTEAAQQARLVLTSRIAGYQAVLDPSMQQEVEMLPFTVADVTAYVESWELQSKDAAAIYDRLRTPALAGLARVPLLLTLLCQLATEPDELPRTRASIFGRIVRRFLRAENRAGLPSIAMDDPFAGDPREREQRLLEVLRPLAFTLADSEQGWIDQIPARVALRVLRDRSDLLPPGVDPAAALKYLSVVAGVLIPAGDERAGADPPYLFVHRTVAEYLVAEHLATLGPEELKSVVDQHLWFEPDWAPVWPIMGALLSASDRLVLVLDFLLSRSADPLHHALMCAARVLGELELTQCGSLANQIDMTATRLLALIDTPAMAQAIEGIVMILPLLTSELLARVDSNVFSHSDLEVRQAAAKALKDLQSQATAVQLIALSNDEHPAVRRVVAQAIQNQPGEITDNTLIALLDDDDSSVRWTAAQALQRRPGREISERLIELAGNPVIVMRQAVTQALGGRPDTEVTDTLLAMTTDTYSVVRRAAALALQDDTSNNATEALLGLFRDNSLRVRRAAARSLQRRTDPMLTERLLAYAVGGPTAVRAAAALALGGHSGPEVTQTLIALSRDSNPSVQCAAVGALRERSDPEVADALISLAHDGNNKVRRAANKALSAQPWPGSADRLLALAADHSPTLRKVAAKMLSHHQGSTATAALVRLAGDESPAVRRSAAASLTSRPGPMVDEVLTELTGATQPTPVRVAGVKALGARNGTAVTRTLVGLTADDDQFVRAAAIQAMSGRCDDVVVDWVNLLVNRPSVEGASMTQMARDAARSYQACLAIANNAQAWPVQLRGDLISALSRYTVAVVV